MLKRLKFITSVTLATSADLTFWSPARAAEFVYKLGTPNPPDYPPNIALVQMTEAVKKETNGRLEIKVYANGLLGSQTSMLTQVRLGSLDMYETGNNNYSGVIPAAMIDSVGYAFSNGEQPLAALDGALGDYIRKEFAAKNLYLFDRCYDISFRQVTNSVRPIRAVEDFAGLKIRTPQTPIFVDLFKLMGASPVGLDVDELYTALQTHLADGQETPLVTIERFRFPEVQKYLSYTNHGWGGTSLVANMDKWNALPSELQEAVKRNERKYALLERHSMRLVNVSLANKLVREGLKPNTVDTSGIRARLGPYYARWKKEFGATAWGLLEQYAGKLG